MGGIAGIAGFKSIDYQAVDRMDYWCSYILNSDKDICQDDLGSVYRDVAEYLNKQADNLRDESSTTEVYR